MLNNQYLLIASFKNVFNKNFFYLLHNRTGIKCLPTAAGLYHGRVSTPWSTRTLPTT